MSSIRLFILDAFERHGEMHGHQLRAYAERERVALWTDISVGSLYQVLKRLVSEELLTAVRTERAGNFPERTIFAITAQGRRQLALLRSQGLQELALRPDPFDLALTRAGNVSHSELQQSIALRIASLRERLAERTDLNRHARPHLTALEAHALTHREHVLRAEIGWHEKLLKKLPSIDLSESDPFEPK